MSINLRIDRQIVTYPYNGLEHSNTKEQITDPYNMDESQKYWPEKGEIKWFYLYEAQE